MTVLLVIIYAAFISLGLPDSLFGSAWPSMYEGFGVSMSSAGMISMTVAIGTVISSLFSDKLIHKLGTGFVTLISAGMTAAALLAISFSGTFTALWLWSIPLGLGAGSIDAALNNFVALHYKASHMNWLHGFWGVGTIIGPLIISAILKQSGRWNTGYLVISILQFTLVCVLVCSMPLWKKAKENAEEEAQGERRQLGILQTMRLPKAKPTVIAFFCYCALEQTVMLWGSSYLVVARQVKEATASGWISIFFIGITLGRMLSGVIAMKFTQKQLIRLGQLLIAIGIGLLLLPLPNAAALAGLFMIGCGCAPIYPSLLHETPNTFGKAHSQSIMGIQMASAYIGTTFMPPLFGLLGGTFGYGVFPVYLAAALVVMAAMIHRVYAKREAVHTDEAR